MRTREMEVSGSIMEAASSSFCQSPPWAEDPPMSSPFYDDGQLVTTSVNHTQDLLRLHRSQGHSGKWKSSSDWLQTHSLQSIGLSLSQLRYQGTINTLAFELYHGKMRWLNQGSMKVFGLVKGSRV
ncbi:von Willebrand factor A domain-containing protein 3A-like [Osmerus eperlanus]|uniref:von Willebrand factor A domain-containing protein 3A-like n=1 Tax=Osmerus eperlanus TaxID=29151 RepID=UPI002E143B98